MAVYRYKAFDTTGRTVVEKLSAASRQELLALMEQRKLYPLQIQKVLDWKTLSADFFNTGKTVTLEEISFFCRQFYTLFHAGVPIPECMLTIGIQTTNAKFKRIIFKIQEKLQEGNTLSIALSGFPEIFPGLLTAMVEAGETAGFLEDVLVKMAVFYEKEHRVKVRIKNAAIYPKFLAFLSVLLVIFMLTFVMPTFVNMFETAAVPIPAITRFFIAAGNLLSKNVILIVLVCMLLALMAVMLRKSELYKRIFNLWDWIGLKIPAIRDTLIKSMSARFAGAFSMLLKSGIPMIHALDITSKVMDNKHGERMIQTIKEKVEKGISLAKAVEEAELFPPILRATVRTGEGSGALDVVLEHISHYFEEELDKSLERLLKLLEPLMIVVMAVVIGVIVIALILPMFDMVTAIR